MFQVEWDEEDLNELRVDLQSLYPEELAGEELPHWSMEVLQDVAGYPPPRKTALMSGLASCLGAGSG